MEFSKVFTVETMKDFPSRRINEEEVKRQLRKALDSQFEIYSFENMVNDCNLTDKEKRWAVGHLTYGTVEV